MCMTSIMVQWVDQFDDHVEAEFWHAMRIAWSYNCASAAAAVLKARSGAALIFLNIFPNVFPPPLILQKKLNIRIGVRSCPTKIGYFRFFSGAVGISISWECFARPSSPRSVCVGIEKDPRVISLPSNQPPIWLNITEYKPDWHILPHSDLQYVYRAAFGVATLVDQWIWSCCIWLVAIG